MLEKTSLEAANVTDFNAVEIAFHAGINDSNLLLDLHRAVLRLLQKLGQARAALEKGAGRRIHVRGKLGKGGHFTILRKLQLHRAGNLLHRLDLRCRPNTADRQADIHGRADAFVEEFGLEEDLAIGDRDHVGRNIGRHVTSLGLDDRQRGQRTGAVILIHLRGTLKQA